MNPELTEKLIKSDSIRSLQMESLVANSFSTNGWSTVKGCYYQDKKDNKVREIDCVSTCVRQYEKSGFLLRIHIVIECKTMKDYHIIVGGADPKADFFSTTYSWFGRFKDNKTFIVELIDRKGLTDSTINRVMTEMEEYFYPHEPKRITDMNINPYGCDVCSSCFRETNSKIDKELDNSVIWRASQALKSAITSFQIGFNENIKDDMREYFSKLKRRNLIQDAERKKFHAQIDLITNCIDIYHPIIVTDAQIWMSNNDQLQRINKFRFSETGLMASMKWWYDVVSSEYISEYISNICEYYYSNSMIAEKNKKSPNKRCS